MRKLFLLPVFLIVLTTSYFIYSYLQEQKLAKITSFDACTKAGYPVMESYPPRCALPNGKSFTQDIGNELDYISEIIIETPRPNQVVTTSPFMVKGKAKGPWFFEGSFSGEVFDDNKKSLGTIILTAEGEWMTPSFVSFSGELKDIKPDTQKGRLVLKNANPSGLLENQKVLTIPVRFTK